MVSCNMLSGSLFEVYGVRDCPLQSVAYRSVQLLPQQKAGLRQQRHTQGFTWAG